MALLHAQRSAQALINHTIVIDCFQGINMTALREIKLLKELESPYIVRLLDVFPHKRNLSLVLAFLLIKTNCFFWNM